MANDEITIDGKDFVRLTVKVKFPVLYSLRLRLAGLVIRFGVLISGSKIKVEVE